MKRLFVLFVLLFLAGYSLCLAQSKKDEPMPVLTLGTLTQKFEKGKVTAIAATKEEVLADPWLRTTDANVNVASYTFGAFPKGKDYMGPFTVNGGGLTPQIIKTIQNIERSQGKILFEGIKVMTADGTVRACAPFVINLVPKKL